MYKTFTSIYLTTGSRVKAAKEIFQFSKPKMAVCYGPNFLLKYLIKFKRLAYCKTSYIKANIPLHALKN